MEPVEDLEKEGGTFQIWQLDMKPDSTAWREELVGVAKDLADEAIVAQSKPLKL